MLRDAAQHVMALPEAVYGLPHWVTAIEWLMLVGEHGGESDGAAHRDDEGAAKA
jgi:hypothetical protein